MQRRARGFTLLEVLVVVLLMGIMLGIVQLSLKPGPARQARQEAQGLIQLLDHLRENAVLEGREFGVRIGSEGYQLMVFERPNWRAAAAAYRLPDGLFFRLELEGRPLTLGGSVDQPQLLLLSSDEMTAFTLHYETAQQRWLSVSSDGLSDPAIDES